MKTSSRNLAGITLRTNDRLSPRSYHHKAVQTIAPGVTRLEFSMGCPIDLKFATDRTDRSSKVVTLSGSWTRVNPPR
jgi:hypothetical protein